MNKDIRTIEAPNAARSLAPIYLETLPDGTVEACAFPEGDFDDLSFTAALVDEFGVERVGKIGPHRAGGWAAIIAGPVPLPLGGDDPTDPDGRALAVDTYRIETPDGSIAVTHHQDGTAVASALCSDFTQPRFYRALLERFGARAVFTPTADPGLAIWRATLQLDPFGFAPEDERNRALDRYAEAKATGETRRCLALRAAPSGEVTLLVYRRADLPFALYAGDMGAGNLADEFPTFDEAWDGFNLLCALAAGAKAGTFMEGFAAAISATLAAAPDSPGLTAIARAEVIEIIDDTFAAGWDGACVLLRQGVERAGGYHCQRNFARDGGHYRGRPFDATPAVA